jgi:uncharacterized membrane protein
MLLDDLSLARAIHVLSLVHWIGGVTAVTTIIVPRAKRIPNVSDAIAFLESFERPFARQVRVTIALVGLSGFYMLWRQYDLNVWPVSQFWWIYLMLFVWILFATAVYVIEPLFLHEFFRVAATRSHNRAFTYALRLHQFALLTSMFAIGAGVFGAHGGM